MRQVLRQRFAPDRLRLYAEMSLESMRSSGPEGLLRAIAGKIGEIGRQVLGTGRDLALFSEAIAPCRRVLFIEARMIAPHKDSGSHRLLRLMSMFKETGYEVMFIPANLQFETRSVRLLEEQGILVPKPERISSLENFLAWYGQYFGMVVLSRADTAGWLLPYARRCMPYAVLVFDTVDLHFLREQREADLRKDPERREKAQKRQRQELDLVRQADVTWVVSQTEAEILQGFLPQAEICVVSNIHSVQPVTSSYDDRTGILFVGGFEHEPNVDAVRFYARDILPLVSRLIPGAVTHIVGSDPPPEILQLHSESLRVHGYVEDLTPFLDGCRLSIAPLRYGAGVKGKVNLSMSYGLPVVATPVAAEGTCLRDEFDVLIASNPNRFAEQMARLYHDPELWRKLSEKGKLNIERHFSPEVARKALQAMLKRSGEHSAAKAAAKYEPQRHQGHRGRR